MTNDKSKLLKVKATLKRRQPKFIRQDAHKRSMKEGWRSPKGLHSKIGDNRKGYRKGLKGGYQTPVAVRGLDKHGMMPTRVDHLPTLAKLDPKHHVIIVASALGGRKKLELIAAAKEKGFKLANASDKSVERIKSAHASKATRKAARDAKAKEREAHNVSAQSKKKAKDKAADGDHESHDHKDHAHAAKKEA